MKRPGDTTATFGASATDAHFTNSGHLTTFQAPLVEISTENERPRCFSIRRLGAAWQKTAKDTERDYLSVKLHDPLAPERDPRGRKFGKAEYQVTTIDGRKTSARTAEGRGRFTAHVKAGMDVHR